MDTNVLAGPILRRTTKNRVCVWLATSAELNLQLTVMDAQQKVLGQSVLASLPQQHAQLGANLHIYLLQARPDSNDGYPADVLLHYRIDKVANNGASTPLFAGDELKKLVYGSMPYPAFFIPTELKNLLHGSCRKPHGSGGLPDALSHAHALMEKTFDKLDSRPALLLLTGDQIYADDVALSLNAMLREQAGKLTGRQELLPQIGDPARISLHGRKQILDENKSGFTSSESKNHLMSFGEYAAMYLYTFGNLSAWEPVWEWEKLQNMGIASGEEKSAREDWSLQAPSLRAFHRTLPDIRRLLANIPTYMIFDDHDVTDDWNITHGWYDEVRVSELGRRIVSNALAACWAFQNWGNDPDNFDKDMVWSIQQRLTDPNNDAAIAERFDLHTWKHRGWGFSVPTLPPIIAMDSRTQRQYDDYNLPAQLMDRYALDWLRVEWAKLVTDNGIPPNVWPVFTAATPVLGFAPIEGALNKGLRYFNRMIDRITKKYLFLLPLRWFKGQFDRKLVSGLDIESWTANMGGYKALFDVLQAQMKLPGCLFLSGDVHYAFTATGDFVCEGETFACLQFTSSAMSNIPNKTNRKILDGLGDLTPPTTTHRVRFAFGKRKRWTSSSTLLLPQASSKPIHAECNIGLVQFTQNHASAHTLLSDKAELVYRL